MPIIPSDGFNEQIKRAVRESERRINNKIQTRNRWHKKGQGGGGSTPTDCSCCKTVQYGPILHPKLPAGNDQASDEFRLQTNCGGDITVRKLIATEDAFVSYTGQPLLLWQSGNGLWYSDETASAQLTDADGVPVSGTVSYARFFMEFLDDDPLTAAYSKVRFIAAGTSS